MNSDKRDPWYNLSADETLVRLNSRSGGLSHEEAASRLEKYGYNELQGDDSVSPWKLLLEQFKNVLIIILLIAVALSAFLGEVTDAIVIFVIIVFAAGLGFFQEYRAGRAIQALKRMAAPLASVLRGGVETDVPARELVPGDVILLTMGDMIPADARVIDEINLRTNEAPLTGESNAVEKNCDPIDSDASLGDRINMVFSGTVAVYGRGKAVVVETGSGTEFGKIARMLKEVKEERTPLQVNLDSIGKYIAIGALILCAVLAGMGIWRGHPPLEMLIWGVSLAVAAVPEALPAVVTISLALGVRRMVKRHALVRRLSAVETLGCTTVICSDKTGTLTEDQMTMKKIYLDGQFIEVSGTGYEPEGEFYRDGNRLDPADPVLQKYLKAANLCANAKLYQEDDRWKIKGDPTEGAFLVAAAKAGLMDYQARNDNPLVGEIPFTSETKRMVVAYREPEGVVAYSNGAAEVILKACEYIYRDGREVKLDEDERVRIHGKIHQMAAEALRVLGTAYKLLPGEFSTEESEVRGMVLLGMGGMIDPPRAEAKGSIGVCDQAGIRTIMITGDHKLTAVTIAGELGIMKGGMALTGDEINGMSEDEFNSTAEKVDVYARVSPEHKLRVVEALARKGHVVAMTGDGVNDAPALKKADIGIAMGIKGTDVTREAADMILTDDNFASIVAAVEEGRAIYDNIKKYLVFLLSCNLGEILLMASAILLGPLLGIPAGALPLIAVQILYVNLATDGLPALALAVDPYSKDVMFRKPRPRNQTVFTRNTVSYMVIMGIWTCLASIFVFVWALNRGESLLEAQSLCFVTLIIIQFLNAFNCRSLERSIFNLGVNQNRWLLAAVSWELTLLVLVVYLPFLQGAFNTYSLTVEDWVVALSSALTIVVAAEIYKLVSTRFNR
ncbi:MAG: cation-translocating P-type ATPase [Dehalococcoidia bacterium]|nr:cation-translocating P-type ATPase [Dehalococcoidia bacterium]